MIHYCNLAKELAHETQTAAKTSTVHFIHSRAAAAGFPTAARKTFAEKWNRSQKKIKKKNGLGVQKVL